jgi:hypothetical protein
MNQKKIKKIELAEQDKIDKLQPYIDKVLNALGHPEALATDESMVCDFLDIFDKDERVKQVKKAHKKIKVNIFPGDYIWEVAKRIKNAKSS